uniref:hypothetical protein n=1 Tax=Desulfovibrio inopinatus TaxID=102109 RepID=UPI00055314C4
MSNALRIAPAKPNCKSKSDSVAIPTPRDVPDGMKPFVAAVTSLLGKREGQFRNAQDSRVITVSDLKEAGLYDSKTNRIDLSGKTDTTPPSAPTNIHVQEFSRFNRVRWTNPTDDDLSHIEIWTHKTDGTPSFDEALLTGLVSAPHEYYDHLGLKPGEKAAYWLRAVDTSDNKSSFNPEPSSDVTITGTVDKASWEEEMYNLFFGDLTNNDGIKAIRKQINVETIQYDETRNYYNQDITLYGG